MTNVIVGFHTLVSASLAVATSSGLLDSATLAHFSPEAQVDGPALALLFAALRSRGDPPSIQVPAIDPNSDVEKDVELSIDTCPPTLLPLFTAWSSLVPRIQRLGPSYTKALSRLTIGLSVPEDALGSERQEASAIALSLRALALEIGQRRSFQLRYQADLQSALDYAHESGGEPALRSDFAPPPGYSMQTSTGDDNPVVGFRRSYAWLTGQMAAIRETLFAALAEVLGSSPELLARLQSSDIEKPRAFFASLALSTLLVATTRCDLSPPPRIRVLQFGASSTFAGMPSVLDVEHCPEHLRPLLQGLLGIAALARQMQDADDQAAIERAMRDEADGGQTGIDRLREHFLFEHSALLLPPDLQRLANAVNEVALGISSQPDFVARQHVVFDLLAGIQPDTHRAW